MVQTNGLQLKIEIEAFSNDFYKTDSLDLRKFFKSSLITTLALTAIAMAILPLTLSAAIIGVTLAGLALFPHRLPAGLLYEIAVIDLIVRAKMTQIFPSLRQSWWHEILPGLYLGGIPMADQNHLEQFKSLGIGAILAILEEDEAQVETFFSTPLKEGDWAKAGIDYRRLSCRDMTAMSIEELESSVGWLHQKIGGGKPVYVHCKAGRGRSAMILIGYLIRYGEMDFKEALNYLASKRSVIRFRPSQLERLQQFAKI